MIKDIDAENKNPWLCIKGPKLDADIKRLVIGLDIDFKKPKIGGTSIDFNDTKIDGGGVFKGPQISLDADAKTTKIEDGIDIEELN